MALASGSGPAMRSSPKVRSAADRAMGPMTARSLSVGRAGTLGGVCPRAGTKPRLGLWANTPQQWAGVRNEPPISEPNSSDTYPAASAAAEPPDDPPGVRPRSQGLLVVP